MTESTSENSGERIAKVLGRAGVCSRREAERAIAEGRVTVNGKVLDTPAFKVLPSARITFDGKPVAPPEPRRLWLYHKPRGLVTTNQDEKGRDTVFDKLPKTLPRVLTVGRLDLNTEGLLLLTNDGGLARKLELPATGWLRKYRVRVHGRVDEKALAALADGIRIDGIRYGGVAAALERQLKSNAWITMALREGKNREIRRILEHLGLKVTRLIRISYGPFTLGTLEEGAVKSVPNRVLAEQLGEARPQGTAKAKPRTPHRPARQGRKSHANRRRKA